MPKLLIIGHGRHGKDTAASMFSETMGLSFISSSEFAAQKAVFPIVGDFYSTWKEAYEDRANHRELWFHAIAAYNLRPGPSLAEQILEEHDMYVGMRRRDEFEKTKHLFDYVIWVDANQRHPVEPSTSMELTREDADLYLDNNYGLKWLQGGVDALACIMDVDAKP